MIVLTKIEYLKARIADLEKAVNDKTLPAEYRKTQRMALLNYKLELERETNASGI